MQKRLYSVYLMASKSREVLYVGVTNNLLRCILEHQEKKGNGFTKKYNVTRLVYFEETKNVMAAIDREKEIKKWRREKRNHLIEEMNPEWDDLAEQLCAAEEKASTAL